MADQEDLSAEGDGSGKGRSLSDADPVEDELPDLAAASLEDRAGEGAAGIGSPEPPPAKPKAGEVELHSQQSEVPPPKTKPITVKPVAKGQRLPRSNPEKISQAIELKKEGNQLVKEKEWKKAIRKYHHGLLHVRGLLEDVQIPGLEHMMGPKATPEEKAEARALTATLSNNLAMCLTKTEDWTRVIECTTTVLEFDSKNTKALFRRGVARLNLNILEQAGEDLRRAQELDPKDEAIRKQLLVLQQRLKQYEKTERKMYSAMFDQSS